MTATNSPEHSFPWDYFALTFGFSWVVWLPAVLGHLRVIPFPSDKLAVPLSILGFFGPMFGACLSIYRKQGSAGVTRYLGRLLDFRIRALWWVVILVLPFSIQAVAHFLPLLRHERVPASYVSSVWTFLTIALMVTLLGGGQEEPGWRGYALDRIQARFNALISSLILGAFWACWHLPLRYMPGTSQGSTPFVPFLVVCMALSVILTWIYNNTGKSMVAVILAHGMVNAAHPLFPVIMPPGADQRLYAYWVVTTTVVAILITLIWGPTTLGKKGRQSSEGSPSQY